MWFDINWDKLVIYLLPTFLRRPFTLGFVRALVSPLEGLYYKWYNWRIDNIYKLDHTGQICYLRGSLNDKFDPVQRRIWIGDGQFYDTFYIFTEAESRTVWLYTEAEDDPIWLRTEPETADNDLDFIVYVPAAIFKTQLDGLKAHIKFYKQGGRRYDIFIDE